MVEEPGSQETDDYGDGADDPEELEPGVVDVRGEGSEGCRLEEYDGADEASRHLASDQFDLLVSDVMDELPQDWAPILDNMAVVVEDEPAEQDLEEAAPHDEEPWGNFRGSGGPVRLLGGGLTGPAITAPPELALFQGPLERASATLDELRDNVRATLIRQIGRGFGLRDDDELDDEDFEADDEDSAPEFEDDEELDTDDHPGDVSERPD